MNGPCRNRAPVFYRFLNALVAATALSITAAQNTHAAFSSGSGGLFRPVSDMTLLAPESGRFYFTGNEIDEGVSVSFGGTAPSVTLTALDYITIRGMLNAEGRTLALATLGTLTLANTGVLQAGNVSISSRNVQVRGAISVPGGNFSLVSTNTLHGDTSSFGENETLTVAGTVFAQSVPLPVKTLTGGTGGKVIVVPKDPKFDPPVKPLPLPIPLPGGLLLLSSALAFLLLGAKLKGRFKAKPVGP